MNRIYNTVILLIFPLILSSQIAVDQLEQTECCPEILNTDNDQTCSLMGNAPNPFNPTTVIQYQIKRPGLVQLVVFNVLGQKIYTLVNEDQHPGIHKAAFYAENLAPGVYFYQLKTDQYVQTRRMILLP